MYLETYADQMILSPATLNTRRFVDSPLKYIFMEKAINYEKESVIGLAVVFIILMIYLLGAVFSLNRRLIQQL